MLIGVPLGRAPRGVGASECIVFVLNYAVPLTVPNFLSSMGLLICASILMMLIFFLLLWAARVQISYIENTRLLV